MTVDDAQSPGCLVSEGLTADLAGTTLRISPLPAEPADRCRPLTGQASTGRSL